MFVMVDPGGAANPQYIRFTQYSTSVPQAMAPLIDPPMPAEPKNQISEQDQQPTPIGMNQTTGAA